MSGKIHRIGVIGSRTITDKALVYKHLDEMKQTTSLQGDQIVVLSGGAKGVDTLTQQWAKDNQVPFILFKPYFLVDSQAEYNPRHYFTRNKQIIDNSDMIIAFWDGTTKGTAWGMGYARKSKKTLMIIDSDSGMADK